ncbi:unnamed protein product [Allacma fusca]|uniref:Elongation of very long chain fatty acids protein n=1 Tax=Allacma fusca TaxID=39272 RepID=A0A8J2LRZ2_9HEXA|nr:unnamed protein product [Allacma fusca]
MTTAFWCLMSTWSKVVELFDTGFVVLRKQRLIFLHWYHHTTVLLFAFYTFPSFDPANRWFIGMNYFIHGVMYSYYSLKAIGIKLPRNIPVTITSFQFLQMVVGVGVNIYTLALFWHGTDCSRQLDDVLVGLSMYFSYMILFGKFFYNSYVRKSIKTG